MGRTLLAAGLSVAAWLAAAGAALAAEAAPPAGVHPAAPLARLPSPPGPHVSRIKELGEDAWLDLGPPAPDPKWGLARGRAWTPRMPCAPDLRAAFLCGCGRHGYVKPDGHFMDDLWAYDINGHRWICLYPGAGAKTLRLQLDGHGFEVNERGEHVPVSFMGHGYCNQTFVPHLNRVMFIYTHSPWWTRALEQRWDWLDPRDDDVRRRNYGHAGPVIENPRHPLFWDVDSGTWMRRFVAGDGPGPKRFEGVLQYVPSRKQAFFLYHGRVWWYDFAADTWQASKASRMDIAYDSWGCHDGRRDRIYVARKEGFWAFDVKTETWSAIGGDGRPETLGSCAYGAVTYDSAADAVLFHFKDGAGIRIYHPATNRWSRAAPPPDVPWKSRNVNAFYDPVLNVHYYHLAGDSDDNGFLLVYRCRR